MIYFFAFIMIIGSKITCTYDEYEHKKRREKIIKQTPDIIKKFSNKHIYNDFVKYIDTYKYVIESDIMLSIEILEILINKYISNIGYDDIPNTNKKYTKKILTLDEEKNRNTIYNMIKYSINKIDGINYEYSYIWEKLMCNKSDIAILDLFLTKREFITILDNETLLFEKLYKSINNKDIEMFKYILTNFCTNKKFLVNQLFELSVNENNDIFLIYINHIEKIININNYTIKIFIKQCREIINYHENIYNTKIINYHENIYNTKTISDVNRKNALNNLIYIIKKYIGTINDENVKSLAYILRNDNKNKEIIYEASIDLFEYLVSENYINIINILIDVSGYSFSIIYAMEGIRNSELHSDIKNSLLKYKKILEDNVLEHIKDYTGYDSEEEEYYNDNIYTNKEIRIINYYLAKLIMYKEKLTDNEKDNIIKHLLKAGDYLDSKMLRSRLFQQYYLEESMTSECMEINMDIDTILKLAKKIKSYKK